jgi:hypothetical protein
MLEALERGIHGYFPFSGRYPRRLRRDRKARRTIYGGDYFDGWLSDELDEAIDEILADFEGVDEFLTARQMSRAVERNRALATQLRWQPHYDAIVRLLASTGCLQPNYTPGWEDLSKAVACWQQRQGLTADGIIGPNTWRRMQTLLRIPRDSPLVTPTQPSIPITSSQPINAASGPNLLNSAQVAQAIATNRRLGRQLNWIELYVPISVYYLRFREQPSEAEFAQAVARWQRAVGGLSVNGILDGQTWRIMRPRGEPAIFSIRTQYGVVQRPRNYREAIQFFGDPSINHEQWRRDNIVKAFAPSGFQFQLLAAGTRNYVWVHKKLKEHFEVLFQSIANAGLWHEIQPVSGPFVYRNVRGGTRLSTHAFGIGIDIRPNLYPRGQNRLYPALPVVEILRDHGFHWGIFLPTPDPHHFQFATGM